MPKAKFLSPDILSICFSAFFADLGYQGVTALFPLFIILELHRSVILYGIITALSFGIGSFFAYAGGKLGDKLDKKTIAILGNIFIPLMSFSALTHSVFLSGTLFTLGWWARYFRTPSRRALLVNVSNPIYRSKVFGFLHALDIAGGMFSVLLALMFILVFHFSIPFVILLSIIPLIISSLLLLFVKRNNVYLDKPQVENTISKEKYRIKNNNMLFIALLVASLFYGFSFYNLGFPILTASLSHNRNYALGILTYAIYLGVSALSGYLLGSTKIKPIRTLWMLGYFPSALSSLLVGLSVLLHFAAFSFYLFIAGLGFSMGTVETFEPTAVSKLVSSERLSSGMGWLSVSRSIGQTLSNLIMGLIFSFSQFFSYFYAFLSGLIAAIILMLIDLKANKQN